MNVYLTTLGTWAVRFWVLDTVVMTVLPSTILVPCPACLLWWATLCFEWLADEVDGSCYQATNNRNSIEISLNDWINEHACSLIFHDVFKIQWNYQNANKFSKILFFNYLFLTDLPASSCACFCIWTKRLCMIWAGDSLLLGFFGIFLVTWKMIS